VSRREGRVRRAFLAGLLALVWLGAAPSVALPATPIQLLPQKQYRPGLYDSGPIPVPVDSTYLRHLVCARSMGKVVYVTGQVMYSTDGGQSWQDWSPFGVSLGEATWDTKRNRPATNADSCSGAGADATGWTHVRLVEIAGGDASVAAVLADLPGPNDAAVADNTSSGWLPDGRQTLFDDGQ
jgi:hypothetical protein